MKYKKILIIILLSLFFISFFPKNSLSVSDIPYTFDDNVLIDSAITNFDSTFNIKNSSYYTEHYNATYSFENDINSQLPNDWLVVTSGLNTNSSVISEFSSHNKVFQLFDNDATQWERVSNSFDSIFSDSIIEFWWATSSIASDKVSSVLLFEGITITVQLFINENDLHYYDGANKDVKLSFITANTFFHVKIILNDTANTFDCYINGIKELNNGGYRNPSTVGIDQIQLFTDSDDTGSYSAYFDAFGYSFGKPQEIDDFSDESIGDEPSGWSINNDIDTYSNITTTLDNRVKPLGLYDEGGAITPEHISIISRTIPNSNEQNIQFDFTKNTVTSGDQNTFVYFNSSGLNVIQFLFLDNDLFYYDGGSFQAIKLNFLTANIFSVIRIDFNNTFDSFDVYIDGIIESNDIDYLISVNQIDDITLQTSLTDFFTFISYFDNFLFNTIYYEIGLNLFPYLNSTGYREVDKYEFALKNINQLYPTSSNNPSGWIDVESGNGITGIVAGLESNDREVGFLVADNGDTAGLRKDNLDISGNFINISFGYTILSRNGINQGFTCVFESSDTTEITGLAIDFDGYNLTYWSGSDFIELRSDLGLNEYYEFNLLLNYELDLVFLDYYVDGVYTESYIYPLTTTGKSGLKKITFLVISQTNGHNSFSSLDYVGIYSNGVSQSTEYSFTVYNIGQTWNTQINNLLFLKANGTFHIGVIEGSYTVGMSMTTFRSLRNYYNEIHTINGYDSDTTTNNATFVFTLQNHYFNISIFKIDGVLLKEGINEYNLIFEHSGVDIDNSYFYVVSNVLYFNHIANDGNLEYIQASFNIDDVNSTDYSISYRSYIDNNAYGYMRINYTDTSNLIQLPPNSLTTTRFILSQERIIRNFVILITDKNNDVITGLTTGYIYNIELLNVLNIQVSVITESLLNMMVPLIIILIPTLAFSKRFGKQVITPFIVLFSLILTITNTIPAWLFFIILFPSLVIIFFKSKDDDV